MSDTMAKFLIGCGFAAAALGGAVTAIVVVNGPAGSQLIAYLVPVLFLALAYGIVRKSRLCAIVATLTYVGMRFEWYHVAVQLQQKRGGAVMRGFWISASVFTVLYLLGIVGTFAWHSRARGAASQPGSTSG